MYRNFNVASAVIRLASRLQRASTAILFGVRALSIASILMNS